MEADDKEMMAEFAAEVEESDEEEEKKDVKEGAEEKAEQKVEQKADSKQEKKEKPAKSEGKKGKKFTKKQGSGKGKPGVVYVGHIPFGFFEKEMMGFFSQFGAVTRLRLSRNKQVCLSVLCLMLRVPWACDASLS